MLDNMRVKLISILMGIFLASSVMQAYALGNALTGSASLSHGAEEWTNNCARCHNLRSSTEFSPNNWQTIMLHMRMQAGVTGQVARNIYAFLSGQSAATQGPVIAQAPNNAATDTTTSVTAQLKTKLALNTSTTVNSNQQVQASAQANSGQSGAAIYQQTCVACHGANGKGAIPGAPDFTSSSGPLKNSDTVLLDRIIKGYQTPGSPMAMPARGGNAKLTDEDLKKTLSYIRSKFGK